MFPSCSVQLRSVDPNVVAKEKRKKERERKRKTEKPEEDVLKGQLSRGLITRLL